MDVRKDNARSKAQILLEEKPGYLLFLKEEMSTYWETLSEKGKGLFLRQGSIAQGMAENMKTSARSHGTQTGSAAHSRASLHCCPMLDGSVSLPVWSVRL